MEILRIIQEPGSLRFEFHVQGTRDGVLSLYEPHIESWEIGQLLGGN